MIGVIINGLIYKIPGTCFQLDLSAVVLVVAYLLVFLDMAIDKG